MRAEQAGGSRPSVGRLAAPLVAALAATPRRCGSRVRRTVAGAPTRRCRHRRPGRDRGRPAHRRDLHGRARPGAARGAARRSRLAVPRHRVAAPSRSWPASPASMPAGAWRTAKATTPTIAMASGPGRARAAQGAAVRRAGLPTTRPPGGFFVLETDRPPPDELVGRVGSRLRAARRQALTFILTPDHQPRRRGPDRRARARGGAAQGARAGLPAGPGARRPGHARRCRRPRPTS